MVGFISITTLGITGPTNSQFGLFFVSLRVFANKISSKLRVIGKQMKQRRFVRSVWGVHDHSLIFHLSHRKSRQKYEAKTCGMTRGGLINNFPSSPTQISSTAVNSFVLLSFFHVIKVSISLMIISLNRLWHSERCTCSNLCSVRLFFTSSL